jgi:pyruvate,orthophosphate dikinase
MGRKAAGKCHPRPPRDQPRRPARHGRRRRHPHRPRRQDLARRRRRPRHGHDRVVGADELVIDSAHKSTRSASAGERRSTRATSSPSTARPARSSVGEVPVVDSARHVYTSRASMPPRPPPAATSRPPTWSAVDRSSPRRRRSAACGARQRRHPEDAPRRCRFGAEGIGLCRTEHMFLGDRRKLRRAAHPRRDRREREAALAELLPLQRKDFIEILEAMDGLPTTIRLIDPPLHEFLPDITDLSVKVAVAEERGESGGPSRQAAARGGQRTARVQPDARPARRAARPRPKGLFALQVRAIARGLPPAPQEGDRQAGDHGPAHRVPPRARPRPRPRPKILAEEGRATSGGLRRPDRLHDRAAAGRPDRR